MAGPQSMYPVPPGFNPLRQSVTLISPEFGPFNVTVDSVTNDYLRYAVRLCINAGVQTGASIVLLAVLLLVTGSRKDKRTSAVFILNALSLAFNIPRTICGELGYTGPLYDFYVWESGDFSPISNSSLNTALNIQIAAIVFTQLMLITIEASLCIQVWAVCTTLSFARKMIVFGLAGGLALVALGFRFALTVTNAIVIKHMGDYMSYLWLQKTSLYLTTASICLFSLIFVCKLASALLARRRMGLKQFGPMQILFIMGCQVLIVPAVFAILQSTVESVPEFQTQVETVVALFLPLSSMWASAAIDGQQPNSGWNSARQGLLNKVSKTEDSNKQPASLTDPATSTTCTTSTAQKGLSPIGSTFKDRKDLEAEDEDMRIYVGKKLDFTYKGSNTCL